MTCADVAVFASLLGALGLATIAVLAWALRPSPAADLEDAYLDELKARRGPPVFTGKAYYDRGGDQV